MTEQIAQFLQISTVGFWHGMAIFFRVGPLVALLPAFGERTVPVRIKLLLSLVFVLVTAPIIEIELSQYGLSGLSNLVLTETIVGLFLGIGIRLFILSLQTAGSIAAQSTSLSQILGGAVADPLPAMGYILIIAALAFAMITGLHIKAISLIVLSYQVFPMGHFPTGSIVATWGVSQVRSAFALAFTLAAPFLIVSVIYNLTLGVINKAMPQLMVAFVGAPLITAGGLLILVLSAPLMLHQWMYVLDAFLANPYSDNR